MSKQPFRVAVIGGGLSGLCLANALLGDEQQRYEVQIYERDTASFDSERGGYQIRLGQDGIDGLKTCLAKDTYAELKNVWGSELSRAPAVIDPFEFKTVAKLATLKLYPQTRAVPRQALKEYLLKLPLKRGIVNFSHRLEKVSFRKTADGRSETVCSFGNGKEVAVDLLVGADGARSAVNTAMGINNVKPVDDLPIIQGRCQINDSVYARLPALLRDNGSVLFFTQKCHGFCAVYDAYVDGKRSENESFLFWGIHLPDSVQATLPLGPEVSDKDKSTALADKFEQMGLHPDGIPTIIRCGDRNVKTGRISSSSEPGDWRAGNLQKGRVILIGDSIHAMTPGRGQGANQAMKDGGELAKALLATDLRGASDKAVLDFSKAFDDAMYKRAFPWVKASEQAFTLTTDTIRGYYTITAFFFLLQAAGLGASALEAVGLKKRYSLDF